MNKELQKHFQIILRTKDKVGQQIVNFAAQVQGTADFFQKIDKNIILHHHEYQKLKRLGTFLGTQPLLFYQNDLRLERRSERRSERRLVRRPVRRSSGGSSSKIGKFDRASSSSCAFLDGVNTYEPPVIPANRNIATINAKRISRRTNLPLILVRIVIKLLPTDKRVPVNDP
jgi:hypothetical protein